MRGFAFYFGFYPSEATLISNLRSGKKLIGYQMYTYYLGFIVVLTFVLSNMQLTDFKQMFDSY